MGYPGDDGSPPDTRAGAPRRTAVWPSDTDYPETRQEWPPQAPAGRGSQPRHRQPTGPNFPNASTGQPPRPPQPGSAGPAGPPERGRASHRRAPGPGPQPGPAADSRPPAGGDRLLGRDTGGRDAGGREGRGRDTGGREAGGREDRRREAGGREDRGREDRRREDRGREAGGREAGGREDRRREAGGREDRRREERGRHGIGRGRGTGQPAAPPPAHEDAWRRPSRRSGDEIQGGTRPPDARAGGSLWSSGAFRTAGPGGHGPVRGYPPAPGAPDPVYPPGQFSPWNSPELRTAQARPSHTAGLGPDPTEPGYSQLAVSDPSADATSTQTWAVLDEADLSGEWTSPPAKSPSQPGPGRPDSPGRRGPFDAATATASAPWELGQPGTEPPAGRTGPAASPGQRPDPARPGYPGEPGAPRPGGRLAARRSREAAMDTPQDTAAGARSRDTGGFDTGGFGTSASDSRDTGGFGTGGVGTRDAGSRGTGGFGTSASDTGGFGTGGFGTGGFGTSGSDTGDFGTSGFDTGGFSTGGSDTGGFGTSGFDTGGFSTGGFDTGGFGTGGFDSGRAGSGRFGAPAGPGTRSGRDTGPDRAPPHGSRLAARGRAPRPPRKPVSRVKMWMLPVGMLVLVGALITVVYMQFGMGHQGSTNNAASATQHPNAPASSAPPGPWKHITTRQDDPTALTLTELFPPRFTAGGATAVRTMQRASGANCAKMVLGGKLQAALRKGGCTQVMRASYLSTGQKIMATIGVLNLANVTDSNQAGKATGATAFIKQLPGAKGPTRNLMKGTGLEEAEIKGHYLILTWAEFTNLKAPKGAKQRAQLDAFSRALVGSTANVSLTSRELLGKPATP